MSLGRPTRSIRLLQTDRTSEDRLRDRLRIVSVRNVLHTPRRAPYFVSHFQGFRFRPRSHMISCALFCAFFFSLFLTARLAYIVPRSRKGFDPSRNLTRGVVAIYQHPLHVLIVTYV